MQGRPASNSVLAFSRTWLRNWSVAMDGKDRQLTIGALAGEVGVGVETVRFYQRRGLLREPQRAHGRIRRYGPNDVERLNFIRSAKELGFSLDEIAELLQLDD